MWRNKTVATVTVNVLQLALSSNNGIKKLELNKRREGKISTSFFSDVQSWLLGVNLPKRCYLLWITGHL